MLFKPGGGGFVQVEEFSAQTRLGGFLRGGVFLFGQRDAALLRHDPHGFGKADVFDLADEAEDVSGNAAAEAMVELAHRVDGERGRFFLVEGAQAGEVHASAFAQTDVLLDHLDDVGLLLDGLCEIQHGRVCTQDKPEGGEPVRQPGGGIFAPVDGKVGLAGASESATEGDHEGDD